ncbi:MAG: hypothetical protein R3E66_00995 [bacterium]
MKNNPFELFVSLKRFDHKEGPKDVRVFSKGRFLYGSYDNGREQIIHVRELAPGTLERMWKEFDGRAVLASLTWTPGE